MTHSSKAFYWMAVPALVLFVTLHTVPALTGVFFSFTDYAGYGKWNFVGLENYLSLFKDDRVLSSYSFTFLFAITTTVVVNILALGLAMLLNAKIKFQTAFRGLFFIPNVLAILIIGYVFNFIFSNSLPLLGQWLGIDWLSTSILANEDLAWLGIVAVSAWQAIAFSVILYLAGLQTIPAELYEAAGLDGASYWRQFSSITFPMIGAFFTINMVLSLKEVPAGLRPDSRPHKRRPRNRHRIRRHGHLPRRLPRRGIRLPDGQFRVYLLVIVAVSVIQLRTLQRKEADF